MLLWLVLAAIGALAWFWKPLNSYAVTIASSDARVACSCHFISGRSLSECRGDFDPGMGMAVLTEDAKEKSVTAWVPPLSSQTATFHQGQGCVLEQWQD